MAEQMGYWIGAPYWGLGYATEAARAMVTFGFDKLSLQRIHAQHFARNPASRRGGSFAPTSPAAPDTSGRVSGTHRSL